MAWQEGAGDIAFRTSCNCGEVEKRTVDYKNGTEEAGFAGEGEIDGEGEGVAKFAKRY